MKTTTTWYVLALPLLTGLSLPAAVAAGSPTALELMCRLDVTQPSYRFSDDDLMWIAPTERGYDAVFWTLTPADASLGRRLMVYDVPLDRVVVLLDDVTRVVAAATGETAAQRLTAVRGPEVPENMAPYKTSPSAEYLFTTAGGDGSSHLIRYLVRGRTFEHLTTMEAGWSIESISRHGPILILARNAEGDTYRLYRCEIPQRDEPAEPDKRDEPNEPAAPQPAQDGEAAPAKPAATLVYLGIEGGPGLRNYHLGADGGVYYRDRAGKLWARPWAGDLLPAPMSQPAPSELAEPGRTSLIRGLGDRYYSDHMPPPLWPQVDWATGSVLSVRHLSKFPWVQRVREAPGTLKGVAPHAVAMDVWCERRRAKFTYSEAGGPLLDAARWREGLVYFARRTDQGARLFDLALTDGTIRDLGLPKDSDGQPFDDVLAVRVDRRGDVYVLTRREDRTVLTAVRSPYFDDYADRIDRLVRAEWKDLLAHSVEVQSIASLHEYGDQHDRGFGTIAAASDGDIYFSCMPHHPAKGALAWRYDVKRGRLEVLGDLDEVAGERRADRVPNMIHARPFEMAAKVYFLGQDPFYGNYNFPGYPPDVKHSGSHLITYDIAAGTLEDVGIPMPGKNIFEVAGSPATGLLYLKEGYHKSKTWHSYDPATGEMKDLKIKDVEMVHVGPAGNLYYIKPDGALVRCDAATGEKATVTRIDHKRLAGVTMRPRGTHGLECQLPVLPDTSGQAEILGVLEWCNTAVRFDVTTGTAAVIGNFLPEVELHPDRYHRGSIRWIAVTDDALYALRDRVRDSVRIAELYALDRRTGQSRCLGALRDERGRIVRRCNALTAGGDGAIYMQATVYAKPGDRLYSRRLLASDFEIYDTCLLRWQPPAGE